MGVVVFEGWATEVLDLITFSQDNQKIVCHIF